MLKEIRIRYGLTQDQVASATGIDRTELSRLESGRKPKLEEAILLENYFQMQINWRLTKNDESIKEAIVKLFQRYPADIVLNAANRWLRQDPETGRDVGTTIISMANHIPNTENPLLPPDIENR